MQALEYLCLRLLTSHERVVCKWPFPLFPNLLLLDSIIDLLMNSDLVISSVLDFFPHWKTIDHEERNFLLPSQEGVWFGTCWILNRCGIFMAISICPVTEVPADHFWGDWRELFNQKLPNLGISNLVLVLHEFAMIRFVIIKIICVFEMWWRKSSIRIRGWSILHFCLCHSRCILMVNRSLIASASDDAKSPKSSSNLC